MTKPTVYVETSVIGYLTSRPNADPEVAGHQAATRKWWKSARDKYTLVVSQVVLQECGKGNPEAAGERLDSIVDLDMVPFNAEAEALNTALLKAGAIPVTEPEDAAHVALAAVHGVEYLVTWNFKHIANAFCRRQIERVIESFGIVPPLICTIEELEGESLHVE